ncbi:glutathione S-transferase family protein [Sorangium sp. So ce385]|uniref:glutathione S-transferase family protein n=1 Tax=Sorangium sp. So ce385 TaxID=3133308 RepID=UPI003F5BE529
MKLYDFAYSPNSRKVRAVAYELGIALEHVHVDILKGASRAPAFLAKNPNGRVPVLEDGDFVLWESNAIIRYLAAKQGTSLVPAGAREQADVDRWLSWQLAYLSPATAKVAFERVVKKLTGQGAPDQAAIDAGTAEFAQCTAVLDAALDGKEYVTGRLSLADFALAAHYHLTPTYGLDLAPHRRVVAWLERMVARSSVQRAYADGLASMQ